MNFNSIIRIRIIFVLLCLFSFIIIGKLYFLQIVKGNEYKDKGEKQYNKPLQLTFDRGSIFFESKDGTRIAVATIKEGYTIAINPKLIKDPLNVYESISTYIDINKDLFIEKAKKIDDPYEEIAKKVDKEKGELISSLKIPGIIMIKESWRVYPADSMAAQSIGLIGFDSTDNIAGRYGLERYYESILSRTNQKTNINLFAEIFSDIKNTIFSSDKKEGDIISSIEPTVENFLEKILLETKNKWNSDSIGGIIMNPSTGEIFALSSLPSFNINDLKVEKDPKVFSNPLIENSYEMGSIIKPLTMATGIDSEAVTADFSFDDKGFLELNGKKISDWDGKEHGIVSMQEILSQSLNIGAATVALKTGYDNFSKYFKGFGIGELTGIDQPNETRGIVKNLENKRDIEIATASYGQGIAITPMQTVRALSVIANGGKLINPHIINKIEYTDGSLEKVDIVNNKEIKQVMKRETANEITKMLVNLVDNALRKGQMKMENYSIAAKTGTAQIANSATKGYYDDRYLHSFFGYFPAYNPQFIVFIYHVYPKNVQYASETLTDPFFQITKFLINYYEIPPDR